MDPLSTSLLLEQFVDQRRYLKNVTPAITKARSSRSTRFAADVMGELAHDKHTASPFLQSEQS
jgi:hypothetical protein